jgi:copper chaperone CopZ
MKAIQLRLVLLLALLFSISIAAEAQKDKKTAVTFSVVGLDCENCQKKVEKNIAYEKGVQDLKVNLKEKKVTVTFDSSKTDVKKLTAAFKKIGFEAKEEEKKS